VHILVAEDDEVSRQALAALLEHEGYRVETARNLAGTETALLAASPDLLILDVTLPDGDGATWLARRRGRTAPTPPVIALTGITAGEDTRRLREAGVRLVLSKPANVTRLLRAIEQVLEDEAASRMP
jgi:DNA-binding response OmpR family regulator